VVEEAGQAGRADQAGQAGQAGRSGPGTPPAAGLVARQRAITVGPIVGDSYAVLSGIAPGDRVIVSGVQRLADGAPIAPAPPSP